MKIMDISETFYVGWHIKQRMIQYAKFRDRSLVVHGRMRGGYIKRQ